MRTNKLIFCFGALFTIATTTFAQKISYSGYTGINFSNLHGSLISDKWPSKAGPSTGLFLEYSLTKSLALQIEANYVAHYYEMKSSTSYPINYEDFRYFSPTSSTICYPYYYQTKYDYSFARFPLVIKYKTPTRLQLSIGGGMYYSLLLNDDLTKAKREAAKKEDRRIYPPKHDWGYLFSADLSYPLTSEIRFFVAGRLTTGQKVFIENVKGENGSSEFGFGLKYTPKSRKENINNEIKTPSDSSFTRCYIKPIIGLLVGWNSSSEKAGSYSAKASSSIGATFEYRLNKTISLQSGVLFERKGYALSDSSLYYHRIATDNRYAKKKVDTKIELDYLTIPLDLKLSFGDPFTFYFNFGLYTGFKMNALCHGTVIEKSVSSYGYTLQKINVNDAVEGYYHDVDFGYQTGLGFQFPFRKNLKFDIGINYSESFSSIINKTDENSGGYNNDDISLKNGCVTLQFGLKIPISR